jgi:hypothetical protein
MIINEIATVKMTNIANKFFDFMFYPPFFDFTFAQTAKVMIITPDRNSLLCKLLQGFALHF